MSLKDAVEQHGHDSGETGGLGREERRVGHENKESRLETRMLSNVRELGEQCVEAAHRCADCERRQEHDAYSVGALEELLHVESSRVGRCTAVFLNRSLKQKQKKLDKLKLNDKI